MTRYQASMLSCDGDEGYCGAVETDYYDESASKVNGVPITATHRAPGWTSSGDEDYCPEHTPDLENGSTESELPDGHAPISDLPPFLARRVAGREDGALAPEAAERTLVGALVTDTERRPATSAENTCRPGCRHRCPECRMGLGSHLSCDPQCELR